MSKETVKKEKESMFTKEQLINSKTYKHRIDLLEILLENGKSYSKKQVEKLINDFMKGSVK